MAKRRPGQSRIRRAGKLSGFLQEGLLGTTVGKALKRPGVGLPLLGLGGLFVADTFAPLAKAVRRGVTGEGARAEREVLEREVEAERQRQMLGVQRQQMERAMLMSASRLAAANPQLYNEVMAGRRLPLGAVVLGGRPRTDLMETLAADMAGGRYSEESGPDQQLAALLGAQ